MGNATCSVAGCDGSTVGRGYCNKHWLRWRKSGDPGPAGAVPKPRSTTCSVAGCTNGGKITRGWCNRHYLRWRQHGDPEAPRARKATVCSVPACGRSDHLARGYCGKHYQRWRQFGDSRMQPTQREKDAATRFWEKVEVGDCWLWTGATFDSGYGMFSESRNKTKRAHRWAYEYLVGPIPDGLTLDHLCRVIICVNPDHLEPVPTEINTARGFGPSSANARKTHCIHGHPFDAKNTGIAKSGERICLTCRRNWDRDNRAKITARRRARRIARRNAAAANYSFEPVES